MITSYVTQLRQLAGTGAGTGVPQSTQPKPLHDTIPAPSQIRWWFLLPVERLTAKQQAQLLLRNLRNLADEECGILSS